VPAQITAIANTSAIASSGRIQQFYPRDSGVRLFLTAFGPDPKPLLLVPRGSLDLELPLHGPLMPSSIDGRSTVSWDNASEFDFDRAASCLALGQEHRRAPFGPMELALDCDGATSEVMAVQQG
jgi:hypothetical protein